MLQNRIRTKIDNKNSMYVRKFNDCPAGQTIGPSWLEPPAGARNWRKDTMI